jgi:hypothetical protein
MRIIGLGLIWMLSISSLGSQAANPFELTPRLAPEQQLPPQLTTQPASPSGNPFELTPRLKGTELELPRNEASSPVNPFELAPREPEPTPSNSLNPAPPPVRSTPSAPALSADGASPSWILPALLGLLALTAIFYIFFRALYRKAYRAMLNDNLLSQLYRERSGGNLGGFLLTYLLFLLSAALFLTLALNQIGYTGSIPADYRYLWLLGMITAVFLAKHLALAIMGYIFPIDKETSRYSFTIMIYAIVLGPPLALAALALAYAAPQLQSPLLYLMAGIVIIAYLIRSLRGLFIANRFLLGHGFHFLLYLCAIEIIPLLWIYKLLVRV